MNLGIKGAGRLSMQKKPRSSKARMATLFPEPERPVMTIISRPSAIRELKLLIFLSDGLKDLLARLSFHQPASEGFIFQQTRNPRQGFQMISGGIFRSDQHKEQVRGTAIQRRKIDPSGLRAKTPKTRSTSRSFPCGIATPSPIAVVLMRSRSRRTSSILFLSKDG